jgi:hypothetical protein
MKNQKSVLIFFSPKAFADKDSINKYDELIISFTDKKYLEYKNFVEKKSRQNSLFFNCQTSNVIFLCMKHKIEKLLFYSFNNNNSELLAANKFFLSRTILEKGKALDTTKEIRNLLGHYFTEYNIFFEKIDSYFIKDQAGNLIMRDKSREKLINELEIIEKYNVCKNTQKFDNKINNLRLKHEAVHTFCNDTIKKKFKKSFFENLKYFDASFSKIDFLLFEIEKHYEIRDKKLNILNNISKNKKFRFFNISRN